MILTTCAACAAPLAHDAPRCVRCKIRYCNSTCQHDHWRRGHKQMCKKIHRGGNAEQYNADKKYKEAVAVAVEACAEDTKGQTCYICLETVHSRTGEGLVRGCACNTTQGFAHVSCLAEQAKILFDEAEEDDFLDEKVWDERWGLWYKCSLCGQKYHGVVRCALGWACWKTYVGRRESRDGYDGEWNRKDALAQLGIGLSGAKLHEDALSVRKAELALIKRICDSEDSGLGEDDIFHVQRRLLSTYRDLDRNAPLSLQRDVYLGMLRIYGEERRQSLGEAIWYAASLSDLKRFEEARAILRKAIPVARRVLGDGDEMTIGMRGNYARAFLKDPDATLDNLREAVKMLEDLIPNARRVLGGAHSILLNIEKGLRASRAALRAREASLSPETLSGRAISLMNEL